MSAWSMHTECQDIGDIDNKKANTQNPISRRRLSASLVSSTEEERAKVRTTKDAVAAALGNFKAHVSTVGSNLEK